MELKIMNIVNNIVDKIKKAGAHKILFFSISFIIIVMIAILIAVSNNSNKIEEPEAKELGVSLESSVLAINEVDEDENIENTEDIEGIDVTTDSEVLESLEAVDETNDEDTSAYDIIAEDLENIKSADVDTVSKYFGVSDTFTPEIVSDRVASTIVTFIDEEDTEDGKVITVHLCTLDYNTMNSEYQSKVAENKDEEGNISDEQLNAINKEIATSVYDGEYKVCYNIPVTIKDNTVVVSEAFKQAITGGWYSGTGIELTPVECSVN
jgi:hypothetical protein